MNLGEQIAKGNTARIFLSDGKIIKIFNYNLPDSEAEYEAEKQKYAYLSGLPVPQIYEVTRINGHQAIIMEYCEGRTVGSIVFDDMAKSEYYIDISVDVQRKIHLIHTNKPELMSEKLKRQISSANILSDAAKNVLIEKLNSIQYEKQLCHGDYHIFNLIDNNSKIVIIDWVDSSAGDIRADVYRTYLLYSQFSINLANLYLRIYCEKSGLTVDEIFQWAPIIAGARLSEKVSSENEKRLIKIVNQYCPL